MPLLWSVVQQYIKKVLVNENEIFSGVSKLAGGPIDCSSDFALIGHHCEHYVIKPIVFVLEFITNV